MRPRLAIKKPVSSRMANSPVPLRIRDCATPLNSTIEGTTERMVETSYGLLVLVANAWSKHLPQLRTAASNVSATEYAMCRIPCREDRVGSCALPTTGWQIVLGAEHWRTHMTMKFIIPTLLAIAPLSGQGAEQHAGFPIPQALAAE